LEECLTDIMQRLLLVHQHVQKEITTLPALRQTTREELYQRLYRAREYMAAFYDRPLTLAELSSLASLSPTHFLRTFKQLFRQTPHQYLTMLRLEHAQRWLQHTDLSITDICFALGFESPGSFSWLFRRQVGCSPTEYRDQKR